MRSDDQLADLFIANYGKSSRLTGNQTAAASFAIGISSLAPLARLFGVNKADPTKIFSPEEDQRLATAYTAEGYMLEAEKLILRWGDTNADVGSISPRALFTFGELRKVIPTIPIAKIRQFFQTKLMDVQTRASQLSARDKEKGRTQLSVDTQTQIKAAEAENKKCCELLDYLNNPTDCFDRCAKPHLVKLLLAGLLLAVLVGVSYGVTTGVTSGITQKLLSTKPKRKNKRKKR